MAIYVKFTCALSVCACMYNSQRNKEIVHVHKTWEKQFKSKGHLDYFMSKIFILNNHHWAWHLWHSSILYSELLYILPTNYVQSMLVTQTALPQPCQLCTPFFLKHIYYYSSSSSLLSVPAFSQAHWLCSSLKAVQSAGYRLSRVMSSE